MIFGIGTDIVAIARLRSLHARFGSRLAERMLAPAEMPAFALAPDKGRFLAKRFAAKEAFAKAAGTGMRAPVHLSAVGVGHDRLGRPELFFSAELQEWLARRSVAGAHLSISDEQEHALAFVILEKAA